MAEKSLAIMHSIAFQGLQTISIEVQVQIARGLPKLTIVGLPDKAVGESRDRVRAALSSLGLALPPSRITINLAPASVQKEGSHYDLPIAVGLLAAMEVLPEVELTNSLILGEVALNGSLSPVPGVLPAAITALAQGRCLICPESCGHEAVWAGEELEILAPAGLLALINHFKGTQVLTRPEQRVASEPLTGPGLADIHGQEAAKRVLTIAAAGGHNMLMAGPPGVGKSMLAQRISALLPPLEPMEALEVSMIHSITGMLHKEGLVRRRPIRDPHHSATMPAIIGGGPRAQPGEATLAHHGVLFLDELPEFPRITLEALRQPLESGQVTVARAARHITYPARFQLIAAMNPCPCGWLSDPARACKRAPLCGRDYQARLSGPLLDRMDLLIDVPGVSPIDLMDNAPPAKEDELALIGQVAFARTRQKDRNGTIHPLAIWADRPGPPMLNAYLQGDDLTRHAGLDEDGRKLVRSAIEKFRLSARSYHRVLRVARTIADLDGVDRIHRNHIAEALSYRCIEFSQM